MQELITVIQYALPPIITGMFAVLMWKLNKSEKREKETIKAQNEASRNQELITQGLCAILNLQMTPLYNKSLQLGLSKHEVDVFNNLYEVYNALNGKPPATYMYNAVNGRAQDV